MMSADPTKSSSAETEPVANNTKEVVVSSSSAADEEETASRENDANNNKGDKSDDSSSSKKKEFSQSEVDLEDDLTMTFPQRLMEILDDEANSEIIAWLPHGRAFAILRKKAFEKSLLPKYFSKQSKYASFTRKLNRWGFVRVTRGPEAGAYYHQFFRRSGHRLCMQMSCQSSNKSATLMKIPTPGFGLGMASLGMDPTGAGGAAATTAAAAAAAAGLSGLSGLYPISLQSAAAQQAALAQQQQQQNQQFAQMHQQQQLLLQQEMMRRAMMNPAAPTAASANNLLGGAAGGAAGQSVVSAQPTNDPTFSMQMFAANRAVRPGLSSAPGAAGPAHVDPSVLAHLSQMSAPPAAAAAATGMGGAAASFFPNGMVQSSAMFPKTTSSP